MAMNPETNKIELLQELAGALVRPDGSAVPKHWTVFTLGEEVVIKNYTFRVAYIGESNVLFEPVRPVAVGKLDELSAEIEALSRKGG